MSSFNVYDSANNRWIKIYGGQSGAAIDLQILDQFIIQNEIPICDDIDVRKFTTLNPFKPNSLCLYLNGIRLMLGDDNDFIILSSNSFRINDDIEYEITDNILVDYKRSDLGI